MDLLILSDLVSFHLKNIERNSHLNAFLEVFSKEAKSMAEKIQVKIAAGIEGFGTEVKRRIMLGTFVLGAGYYKAQKVRKLIKNRIDITFEKYDIILSPTTLHPAFKLRTLTKDPIAMYLEDIFTVHINLVGALAISGPGFKKSEGLQFDIQAHGKTLKKEELFSFVSILDKLSLK